jgi:hypothetical protein
MQQVATSGTQMDSWGCNGGTNQQWRVFSSRLAGGQFQEYEFQNEASGLCLDIKGSSSANGTPVVQWPCNTRDNAQWWQMGNPNSNYSPPWFVFLNDASSSWMVISSDSHTWGAKLEGWRPSNLFSDTTTGGIHRAAHAIPDRPFLACLHRPTRICPIRADEIMMNRPAYLRRPIPLGTMR